MKPATVAAHWTPRYPAALSVDYQQGSDSLPGQIPIAENAPHGQYCLTRRTPPGRSALSGIAFFVLSAVNLKDLIFTLIFVPEGDNTHLLASAVFAVPSHLILLGACPPGEGKPIS